MLDDVVKGITLLCGHSEQTTIPMKQTIEDKGGITRQQDIHKQCKVNYRHELSCLMMEFLMTHTTLIITIITVVCFAHRTDCSSVQFTNINCYYSRCIFYYECLRLRLSAVRAVHLTYLYGIARRYSLTYSYCADRRYSPLAVGVIVVITRIV